MKPVVLLFICVFMMLLCGCQSWCGRYEAQHKLRSPEVYPYRFHIKELRLEAEHYASQEACVVKSKILKQNLLKNYPQYFSDKSSGTLPLEFTIKRLGNKAIQTEYFWIFFLDAVARFDRNKLQEYYYSKISPNMRLLE